MGRRVAIDALTGTVALDEALSGMTPYAINNQGTAAGWADGSKGVYQAVARYTTQLEKLKDGRKDLSGVAYSINESNDLGFESEQKLWIYTDEHGKLMLDSLIHPDSVAVYLDGISRNEIVQIGERDGTGFFPILDLAVRSDGVLESFVLSPQTPE
jgi:hypothetical protein